MTRILMILTSCDRMGEDGAPTGFYWEEMAVPYWAFRDAGHAVDLASPLGGRPPADPSSDDDPSARPEAVTRFMQDTQAMNDLNVDAAAAADKIGGDDCGIGESPQEKSKLPSSW